MLLCDARAKAPCSIKLAVLSLPIYGDDVGYGLTCRMQGTGIVGIQSLKNIDLSRNSLQVSIGVHRGILFAS